MWNTILKSKWTYNFFFGTELSKGHWTKCTYFDKFLTHLIFNKYITLCVFRQIKQCYYVLNRTKLDMIDVVQRIFCHFLSVASFRGQNRNCKKQYDHTT